MPRSLYFTLALMSLVAAPAAADVAVGLRGSPGSMVRQHEVALINDFTFLRSGSQVMRFVENGYLVEVPGNDDYRVLESVSYPYARPAMRTFIERLGRQHREACGEPLVVTSLTRPTSDQPGNSHRLSVHPTGMAVDLRVRQEADCRSWLEDTLLSLERSDLLDVTRERHPPHYHVALFPDAYMAYAAPLIARDSAIAAAERRAAERAARAEGFRRIAAASSMYLSAGAADDPQVGYLEIAALAALPLLIGAAVRLRP